MLSSMLGGLLVKNKKLGGVAPLNIQRVGCRLQGLTTNPWSGLVSILDSQHFVGLVSF